ncbi:hypothetical protein SAMN04487857_12627 [Pseudomonas sp. ok272]|uniref:hypothetical protein n=1 Tax=Pseudomonas sp. ok272 TaxID=1761897 RepID=UPI0008CA0A36|nr:hypothetical protein [Pseudomonas sp. ok272]SEN62004.1 hypothetical protein SAMN04487857_12627 [Pseudomonas sp. ok272]
MADNLDSAIPQPQLEQPYKAGDVEPFPSGRVTYLAPLPLPSPLPLPPHGPHIDELNDVYIDFGMPLPEVFMWQMTLGVPFTLIFMLTVLAPLFASFMFFLFGLGWDDISDAFVGAFDAAYGYALVTGFFTLFICLAVWLNVHNKRITLIPTRFNRQRREVCFMLNGATEPTFIPWESLSAWVIEAQGVTQYGVHRQYGMGLGFYHEDRLTSVEFPCAGLPLAISHWEAIRGFMEYEVNDLKSIQDPLDLQGPDDPPHEGLHTFYNARARMHQEIRDGHIGRLSGFIWYLYHVMTFWTVPNHLVEWEIRRLKAKGRQALPEVMRQWSEPLPKEQWAKPSPELLRMSEQVRALHKRQPRRPITEIFAEVYRSKERAQ